MNDILREDHHVHSTYSEDATSTLAEDLAAASERGLRTVCVSDHVRADTDWLPEYVANVRAVAAGADLTVLCGVEAKLLDATGRLDLPADARSLDRVLVADHQYPGPDGPIAPGAIRSRLDVGMMVAEEVVDGLLEATANALRHTERAQVAHLFSLLPKVGLDESIVDDDRLRLLADVARSTGAIVEVNEKWGCPGPAAIAVFAQAGVTLVASTDSHQAADVGRYERVPGLLDAAGVAS